MSKLLNLLSQLTASSPETLLNARAEFGIGKLSNKEELSFVIETLMDDMIRMFDPNKTSKQHMSELVGIMLEDHLKKNDKKFLAIFNRVLVYYYNADLKDSNAFVTAIAKFSNDFELLLKDMSK